MKRGFRFFGAILTAMVGLVMVTTPAIAGPTPMATPTPTATPMTDGRVTLCHKGRQKIVVSVNAVPAHLAHGDSLPGDDVPGMDGYRFDDACVPEAFSTVTFTPVEWTLTLDDFGPGIHTIFMIADVSPLTVDDLQDLGGSLVWDETEVMLCSDLSSGEFGRFISIRAVGDGFLRVGDGFQSNFQGDGCAINAAMEKAFDDFGLPQTACLFVKVHDVDNEFCAPLNVIP